MLKILFLHLLPSPPLDNIPTFINFVGEDKGVEETVTGNSPYPLSSPPSPSTPTSPKAPVDVGVDVGVDVVGVGMKVVSICLGRVSIGIRVNQQFSYQICCQLS